MDKLQPNNIFLQQSNTRLPCNTTGDKRCIPIRKIHHGISPNVVKGIAGRPNSRVPNYEFLRINETILKVNFFVFLRASSLLDRYSISDYSRSQAEAV